MANGSAGNGPRPRRSGRKPDEARRIRAAGTAASLAVMCLAACAPRQAEPPAPEGRLCPASRVDNYLAERWQQCWFDADHGRWRTLSHDFHYDVLVVEVEADSLDDATGIAQRFVDLHAGRFTDMTIYVHQAPASQPGRIRRVHWAWGSDVLETFDFVGVRGQ